VAVAFKAVLGEVGSTTSGTTLVLTTAAAIDVGDFVIIRASADNLNASTPTFTCADSATGGSNVYTTHIQRATNATAAAGVAGTIMATVAVRPVPAGGTITVTLSGSVTAKSMFARSFTGVLNTLRNAAVSAAGASTAAAVTSGSATIGDLVCGAVAAETRSTPTGDSDTTGGSWQAMEFTPAATGGSDATRTIVTGQYKIATAAGAQTYNNTTANTDWVALIAIFQPAPDPAISQAAYQWFAEGTEAGAASLAAQNTAVDGDINNGDRTGTLRVRLQETGSGPVPATDDWQLQYEKNASGTWVNITPSSVAVQTYDSPNLTGTGSTTNRLTGGTGSFTAGEVSEDGTANDKGWATSGFTEFVYALKIVAADVVAGDTLRFRVLRNGATTTMTYSVTPTINVIRSAVDHPASISTNWGPAVGGVADSYSETNANTTTAASDDSDTHGIAQSFLGNGAKLAQAAWWCRNGGTASGTTIVRLYATTGTHGVNAIPSALLTASTGVPANGISTSDHWEYFTFDGMYTLVQGTVYALTIEPGMQLGTSIHVGTDTTSPSHPGNTSRYSDIAGWTGADSTKDYCFQVLTVEPSWATATGTVEAPAGTDWPATIASAWGTWTATAAGTVTAEVITGAITTGWGSWTATAAGTVIAEVITATITTTWGTWTATAAGTVVGEVISATITTSWGTWTATAAGTVTAEVIPATIVTSWGTWSATATAQPIGRYGTILSSWGVWSATATGSVSTPVGWSIPPNVLATTTGQTTITVTWDDVPAATGYDVERNGTVIAYDHPDSPYNDSGLDPDTLYSYRVRAVG